MRPGNLSKAVYLFTVLETQNPNSMTLVLGRAWQGPSSAVLPGVDDTKVGLCEREGSLVRCAGAGVEARAFSQELSRLGEKYLVLSQRGPQPDLRGSARLRLLGVPPLSTLPHWGTGLQRTALGRGCSTPQQCAPGVLLPLSHPGVS